MLQKGARQLYGRLDWRVLAFDTLRPGRLRAKDARGQEVARQERNKALYRPRLFTGYRFPPIICGEEVLSWHD
jgi:hypothetical protein